MLWTAVLALAYCSLRASSAACAPLLMLLTALSNVPPDLGSVAFGASFGS